MNNIERLFYLVYKFTLKCSSEHPVICCTYETKCQFSIYMKEKNHTKPNLPHVTDIHWIKFVSNFGIGLYKIFICFAQSQVTWQIYRTVPELCHVALCGRGAA